MKIAIVGTGISGMLCAWLLRNQHELTVFEQDSRIGGHTHTVEVEAEGQTWPIDTGFIVFNDWTYPNFIALLERLGVPSQPSSMSFSVQDERNGLEYNGSSLDSLFAQRRNLFRPSFHRLIRDILRFNRESRELLEGTDETLSLGDYVARKGYSRLFLEDYIVPMGAAIWSAPPAQMLAFPARFFVRFFANHGMLAVDDRPTWRVIRGGSHTYMRALAAPLAGRVRTATPVRRITRRHDRVDIESSIGVERFDQVIVAAHSDQALALLSDPSTAERSILGAIPYQENEAVLHTDARLLPRSRRAWAAWNYHVPREARGRVALTYSMNILQGLATPTQFCVTLNKTDAIDPARILRTIRYHHPVYTSAGIAAQQRWGEINGTNRTWYCGAYWGFGFHEDGVKSALAVTTRFGVGIAA